MSAPTPDGERVQPDALIGATLDARYRILRVIGEGGMGVVYAAEHVLIEKQVAIKVLRDTFTGRPDVVERFRQEAKSASKIGHPNIVDVSDFGETPSGQSY
ncbi:MAG TPA: protein kinase, partial [Polyangiales bacterium]|nr:protein kinase [Polyangiales bacterium]